MFIYVVVHFCNKQHIQVYIDIYIFFIYRDRDREYQSNGNMFYTCRTDICIYLCI